MNVTRTAIRRPVTVSMFVIAVVLFGYVSLGRLALNLLPDISYPSLTVQTDYEDAAPEEIESLITRPIEEAVGVIPGLSRLHSISRSGQSEVVLEFGWDKNMDVASMDVREKLDLIEFPRDAGNSILLRFDPSYDPIMRLQLYGSLSMSRLRYIAEQELKKGLESTAGVAAVKIVGGLEEQIRIEADEKRLAELGIPITELTEKLKQENLNQASGSLYDLDSNYLVRMLNEFRDVDEIGNIILRNEDGRPVLLSDVAQVWRGTKDRGIVARYNGQDSVELAIYKEGDANTVTVSKAVHSRLEQLKKGKFFPREAETAVVFDQATFIEQAVNNVLNAALLGGLLAIIVLFVFLRDVRSTVIIALSIPVSVMAAFALMFQTGITLNIMSLGGVALGVGMLVDSSIVVLESAHRHRQRGGDLREAVYRGTKEVGLAVTASTLTTVAVFLPLVFVEGIAGQLFTDQALTITYSLMASLIVALTLLPMLLALRVRTPEANAEQRLSRSGVPVYSWAWVQSGSSPLLRVLKIIPWLFLLVLRFIFRVIPTVLLTDGRRLILGSGGLIMVVLNPVLNLFDRTLDSVRRRYRSLLETSLDHKAVVILTTVALAALSYFAAAQIGTELIPPLTQGEFTFEVELPEGSPIEQTTALVHTLEGQIRDVDGVATVFSSVGGSNKNQFARNTFEEHAGQISVTVENRDNAESERQIIASIREHLDSVPDLSYTFQRPTLFSFKTPIEVEIYAFDLLDQRIASDKIAAAMTEIEGLSDVQTSTELGNPEVQIRFDRARIARYGLDEAQIANVLRNKVRGDVASRYRDGDRQLDMLVRANESDRTSLEDLRNLVVNSSQQQLESTGNQRGATEGAQNSRTNSRQRTSGNNRQQQNANTQNTGFETNAEQETPRIIPIRLEQIANLSIERGPAEIRRVRSQRAAVVTANLTGRDLGSVSDEIRAVLADLRAELPINTVVGLGGQNEELETSYRSLMFALGLAVFLVYLVMASQFESLIHPFIILFTVPLALVGVIFSLVLSGSTISVMVLLGVIILIGIVVNNAIVLVDYTNQLRSEGLTKREALVQAGEVRLRPILMTTLTTVLGLIPMALGWGEGAEMRAPMAITVMGGLLFSTLLTLVLIPVVYEWVDRKHYKVADDYRLRDEDDAPAEDLSGGWGPVVSDGD